MGQEPEIGDHLAGLENELHDLVPAHARLDTAQTLYLAGQQSMRRQQRWQSLWPISSACLAVICITLGVLVASPTEPRIVYGPREESAASDQDQEATPHNSVPRRQPGPNQAQMAASPADAVWRELANRLQQQRRLLDDPLSRATAGSSSGEPAVIETVSYSDWPALLTDQSVGERFQALSEPLSRHSTSAIQYLTTFFPTRGS